MGVYLKNNNWFIDYRLPNGKRRREKIGTSKTLAETVLNKRKVEIAEGKFLDIKREKMVKFVNFVDEFYELHCVPNHSNPGKSARTNLKQLKSFFGGKYLHEIDTMMVEQFKRQRMQEVKPASVNRALSLLKCLFYRAIDWDKFEGKNPVKKVKLLNEGNGRLRYLEQEEIARLISNCEGNLKSIVILAVNTGMRRGEIFDLKWHDIDFRRSIIHLYKTKNKEKREVFLNEDVKNTLIAIRKNPKSPFVFCYKNGQPVRDIRKPWVKALKKSNIKDFVFHSLRHTFCSQLVMAGVDINTVKELAGHKTLQMTLRYSHLSQSHKQRAVDVLAKRLDTKQLTENEDDINQSDAIITSNSISGILI